MQSAQDGNLAPWFAGIGRRCSRCYSEGHNGVPRSGSGMANSARDTAEVALSNDIGNVETRKAGLAPLAVVLWLAWMARASVGIE